jgi:hypothetical protein
VVVVVVVVAVIARSLTLCSVFIGGDIKHFGGQ